MKILIIATVLALFCGSAFAQTSSLGPVPQSKSTQQTTDTDVTVSGSYQITAFEMAVTCASGCLAEIFDLASPPADGTYTGSSAPKGCFPIQAPVAPSTWSLIAMLNPVAVPRSINGISVVVNTGADCYHLTKAAAYISMQYQ